MAIFVGPRRSLLLAALVVCVCLLSSLIVQGTDFEYCNKKANYPVKISGVEIQPDPIETGKPAKFKISATTGDVIYKGKVELDVKYYFLHVHSETKDLCEETSCPITTGDFVLSHEQTLPSLTPPGSYTLTMKIYGEDGKKQLSCIDLYFSISWLSSSVADI
ncbi:uncharacterized protein A4U43_C07F33740 [Asparagus officinalis]|uniref:MD-2-related lipid-recognition domain-containing protein n=1 Tax=Asparagus officinalis TaxID=4686 RepID=A0A5P1EGT2_ASPOF|nr:phosphatidylglycerol/phosphatidylinositol transfer protein-like [Asparagus officinalis]ONK65106.1 uncharacterized protein A4U43_C07F33740 [Asparagus officinalis]